MKWLRQILEKVCADSDAIPSEKTIRVQNYSISVIENDNLYSIRVTDLVSFNPPRITGPLFHDELESTLSSELESL